MSEPVVPDEAREAFLDALDLARQHGAGTTEDSALAALAAAVPALTAAARDDLAAKVAALAEYADQQGRSGTAGMLRALLGGDTSALDRVRAEHGERIAVAIHEAKPKHFTRDYTPVDAAYDNCARIARAGGTP